MNLFNLHNHSVRLVGLLSSPFQRWVNWGIEGLRSLLKWMIEAELGRLDVGIEAVLLTAILCYLSGLLPVHQVPLPISRWGYLPWKQIIKAQLVPYFKMGWIWTSPWNVEEIFKDWEIWESRRSDISSKSSWSSARSPPVLAKKSFFCKLPLGLQLTVDTECWTDSLWNPENWGPSSTFKYTFVSFQNYRHLWQCFLIFSPHGVRQLNYSSFLFMDLWYSAKQRQKFRNNTMSRHQYSERALVKWNFLFAAWIFRGDNWINK